MQRRGEERREEVRAGGKSGLRDGKAAGEGGKGGWGGRSEVRATTEGKKDCSAKERGAARVIMLRSSTVPRR